MAEVTLTINGRNYGISCDDGQEQRVLDLGSYVDQRLKEMARAGAANTESHLLVLTSILMADEIFDLREQVRGIQNGAASNGSGLDPNDPILSQTIDELAERINSIAERLQGA